MKDIHKGGKY